MARMPVWMEAWLWHKRCKQACHLPGAEQNLSESAGIPNAGVLWPVPPVPQEAVQSLVSWLSPRPELVVAE